MIRIVANMCTSQQSALTGTIKKDVLSDKSVFEES